MKGGDSVDKVKVQITDEQKKVKVPTGTRMLIRRCCNAAITLEKLTGAWEVSVTLVDDEMIREINLKHRNVDMPTDVLSFPMGENGQYDVDPETGAKMLGDIVISVPTAIKQARKYGHTFRREIGYLTVHAMLHLLGYEHEAKLDAVKMREKEENIMTMLGLPRTILTGPEDL